MKRYLITFHDQVLGGIQYNIKQLGEVLKELGIYDYHLVGDYGVVFVTNLSPTKHRLICAYLESLSAEVPIKFEATEMEFEFQNYAGTIVGPYTLNTIMNELLAKLNENVAKVLGKTSMEFQQQARVKIAEHCQSCLTNWSKPSRK